MAIVYQHIRQDTGLPFYIGIGKTKKRAYEKSGRNTYWYKITNFTPYTVEILFEGLSWEQACQKEIELIKKYGRRDLNEGILCNLTDGGDGNVNWTPKLRVEQSNRMKGKPGWNKDKNLPTEQKEKISQTRKEKGVAKGEKNPMFGKKGVSSPHYGKKRPEHSQKLKGRPKPKGFGKKVSESKQGNSYNAKLTEQDVLFIRKVYKRGDKEFGNGALSRKFGVSLSLISVVVNNKAWQHV